MLLPIIAGFGFLLALRLLSDRQDKKGGNVTSQYVLTTWGPILKPMAESAGLNLDFVLKWIDMESGGNPCAFGSPNAKGPDGNPRELGLAQLYNPDDLIKLKLKGSDLRAYCAPGTQRVTRVLTGEEMRVQAQSAVDLIKICRANAANDLLKVGAAWSPQGRDFHNLIKLQHGLPGISRSGLPAVTKSLGHPPTDWAQFRATLSKVKLDPGTERYRSEFDRVLLNAEKCGSVIK